MPRAISGQVIQQQAPQHKGLGQTLLGLGSMIPSPVQPFFQGANAVSNLITGGGGAGAASTAAQILNKQLTSTPPINEENDGVDPHTSQSEGQSAYQMDPPEHLTLDENPNTQYNTSEADVLAWLDDINPDMANQARKDPEVMRFAKQLYEQQKGAP